MSDIDVKENSKLGHGFLVRHLIHFLIPCSKEIQSSLVFP